MVQYQQGKWDLTEITKNPKSPQFQSKVKEVQLLAQRFEKLKSKLDPKISSKEFKKILIDLETISEKLSLIGGYASLSYSANTQSDEATSLMTMMSKLSSDISNKILFFDLWWKTKIDEKNANRLIKESGELSEYLNHKRLIAKYSLSEPEEKIINTLDVTGISALVKLYDKITNAYQYKMKINKKIKILTREEVTNYVRNSKPKTRE